MYVDGYYRADKLVSSDGEDARAKRGSHGGEQCAQASLRPVEGDRKPIQNKWARCESLGVQHNKSCHFVSILRSR